MLRTADFNYELPPELIAQHPAAERDASRLLVLHRDSGRREHRNFPAILDYLKPGDVLVTNNSKVIPARLRAVKPGTGGAVEVLLVEEVQLNEWWVMLKPGKRVRPGTRLQLLDRAGQATPIIAEAQEKSDEGHYRLRFEWTADIRAAAFDIGEIPLPPYIQRPAGTTNADLQRYQTVYAGPSGSVAAPTAGLHFTPALLTAIGERGVERVEVTLHVGLGTFGPVKAERVQEHRMHSERYEISTAAAQTIARAKKEGRRVVAVGTTATRVLESAWDAAGHLRAEAGETEIFIYPPYRFRVVDALLTNFHLPESTLLMLVSAFAAPGATTGREVILQAYADAVRERYRFFSYGDAMLIL